VGSCADWGRQGAAGGTELTHAHAAWLSGVCRGGAVRFCLRLQSGVSGLVRIWLLVHVQVLFSRIIVEFLTNMNSFACIVQFPLPRSEATTN
jgi:hypothetical protein